MMSTPLPPEHVERLAEPIYEAYRLVSYGGAGYLPMWHELEAKPTGPEVEALLAVVANLLAEREAEVREQIVAEIEAARNRHWRRHLRDHPLADRRSCPADYAAHDAYEHAARIARGQA